MRILEVNGTSLLGATHQEAVNALRAAGNDIQVIVCKGYDKSSLIHSIGSAGGMSTGIGGSISSRLGSRASETGSERSQSVSSLDREDADESINSTAITTKLDQVCWNEWQFGIWCESAGVDSGIILKFSSFAFRVRKCSPKTRTISYLMKPRKMRMAGLP